MKHALHALHPLHTLLFSAALAVALTMAATAASAQTWNYKSYKKGSMGGQYDKDRFTTGTIAVTEKDGQSFFRMNAGHVDMCLNGELPAVVTKTDLTTTVEPQIRLAGCDKFRYVIRNDGSGGDREVWRNDKWVNTKWDHDLTPVKN
jgi:hypothetical protein